MATSRLKERIDYVMNYSSLKSTAPSSRSVAVGAVCAMVLFTGLTAFTGARALAATDSGTARPYAVRIDASRSGEAIVLTGRVSENATQRLVAAPTLTFTAGEGASATSSSEGLSVMIDARSENSRVAVDVTIERDGEVLQRETISVVPTAARRSTEYSGAPLTLNVADADIREVLANFGRITGMQIEIADDVQGKVSVAWTNIPWDQAFEELLEENRLAYSIEGSTVRITRK